MLPWQTSIWNKVTSSQIEKRLAHALLLHGNGGIGKNKFALELAHWLICEQPLADKACGSCKACHLIQADSHPDLLKLTPEEEGKAIKVDQVRELIEKLSLTAHSQGYRVIIISPADALNINASNSLLKILEEPPANTVFILISDTPSKLMATIRSRTQMIRFDLPSHEQSMQWLNHKTLPQSDLLLKLAGGAPLAAFTMAENEGMALREKLFNNWLELAEGKVDALESANVWLKEGFKNKANLPLNWVMSWIMDMIRARHGGHTSSMVNTDYSETLQNLAGQVDLKSLYSLLDRLIDTMRLTTSSSANQQNLLEGLLLHWSGLKRSL